MSISPEPEAITRAEDDVSRYRTRLNGLGGVLRLLAFAALVAALAVILDAAIDRGLRRIETSQFGVWNRIVDGSINADIVVSGSSRALVHYDPRIIAQRTGATAFNIGLDGSQTDMQLARLRTYLSHNRKPRLIVHNLDAFSLQTSREEFYEPAQYLPYLDETPIYSAISRIRPGAWKWRYVPLYGYAVEDLKLTWIRGLLGLVGRHPKEDHILGYKPRDERWNEDFERYKAMNPNGVEYAIMADGAAELEALVRLCSAEGIPLILVYSPEYSEVQGMTRNRARIFEHFHILARAFSVPFWDYSSSPISSQKSMFYNSQHLNADGAAVFSREIASRLASELLLMHQSN
jgi:hypothetical protein